MAKCGRAARERIRKYRAVWLFSRTETYFTNEASLEKDK